MTSAEENYLKTIFKIAEKEKKSVGTNAIAFQMKTSAASVSDMLKKLADKELIHYEKYKGVSLTNAGNKTATHLIRKHRLWKVFLASKLRFGWHQVADIAEELEHIDSDELISRLDAFLDYPKFDPHGDPIPNAEGRFTLRNQIYVSDMTPMQSGIILGVREHDTDFLKYLTKINIKLGTEIKVLEITEYDKTMQVLVDQKFAVTISKIVSQQLLVRQT
jgi:DtxR family Mn-dependent transcriptional regulator